MKLRIALALLVAALAFAPAAAAHVTVNPNEAPADSFFRFAIRVPTERPVATTEITVQLPEGLFFVSFQPKPGWKWTTKIVKLDEPVELFGEPVTERVASVTWTGGRVGPGEFDEFGMSAKLPNTPGRELVFPALQTYANGEVVRWIGAPDAEEPAPRVTLTAAEEEEASQPASQQAPPVAASADEDDGNTNLALGLGIAGLLVGLAALAVAILLPRRRAAPSR